MSAAVETASEHLSSDIVPVISNSSASRRSDLSDFRSLRHRIILHRSHN
jgi:hypothetical protein